MPTKKRRVGFIPRNDVLDIINELSYENNLSFSKVINLLVEEALYNRGLYNISKRSFLDINNSYNNDEVGSDKTNNLNKEFNYKFNNKLLKEKNLNLKELKDPPFDNEIYEKFLMFLEFQEKMQKRM